MEPTDGSDGSGAELEAGSDVTRRDALKRLGVAAGVAWSAPVVMSFYSAASADVGTPPPATTSTTQAPPIECIGGACESQPQCSSADPDCVCVNTTDGLGLCIPGSLICTALEQCGPNGECPAGTTCAPDTCCGIPVCIPLSSSDQCPPDLAARRSLAPRVSTGPGTVGG